MKMSEVSRMLQQLPDSKETRERVASWLKQVDVEAGRDEKASNHEESHSGNREPIRPEQRVVSPFQGRKRAGEVPFLDPPSRAPRLGPTPFCSGSKGQKGSTASHGGSCNQSIARSGKSKQDESSRNSFPPSNEGKKTSSTSEVPSTKRVQRSPSRKRSTRPSLGRTLDQIQRYVQYQHQTSTSQTSLGIYSLKTRMNRTRRSRHLSW